MTDRPLLFSGAMIRQARADLKTKTRRLAKPRRRHASLLELDETSANGFLFADSYIKDPGNRDWLLKEAPCLPGDTLWVRENFMPAIDAGGGDWRYAADYDADGVAHMARLRHWIPSIHMPRVASRITLRCDDVQVERLHDITDADAVAEGITTQNVIVDAHCAGGRHTEVTADRFFYPGCPDEGFETPIDAFRHLWEKLHGLDSWKTNPMLWVISFERVPG